MCGVCAIAARQPNLFDCLGNGTNGSGGIPIVTDQGDTIFQSGGTSVVSVSSSGSNYVDGIIYGFAWNASITYSFADSFADFGTSYGHTVTGFRQVSAQQQDAIESILEGTGTAFTYGSFEQVSNLDISLATDPNGPSDIAIGEADFFDGFNLDTARVADFAVPGGGADGGDVWFGNDGNQFRTPQVGDYSWVTHIHEFGHAVGLSHGHDTGGSTLSTVIPVERDSMEYSVMSYRSHVLGDTVTGYRNEQFGFAQTLMMLDIAALQYMYGANFTTNNTATTYTWNSNTGEMSLNGVGQGAPGNGSGGSSNRIFLTVWDGGGIDTYDLSNYNTDLQIDLRPGEASTFSTTQLANLGNGIDASGNVYNALMFEGNLNSLIENAIGGRGNDEIIGNQTVNTLEGGRGNDTLDGRGAGDILRGGNGRDILYGDFDTNATLLSPGSSYSGDSAFSKASNAGNSSLANAFDVTSEIGYNENPNAIDSELAAHVSISGQGGGQRDWYSFTILTDGTVILDIDGTTGGLDARLRLYDDNGTLIAENDDGLQNIVGGFQTGEAPITDEGTSGNVDSLLLATGLTAGTYFVEVFQWSASSANGTTIGLGQNYTLNITVPADNEFLREDPTDGGADFLFGDAGDDFLYGQVGADWLYGGDDNDTLNGGAGADLMWGDDGEDIMNGGDDGDFMWGGADNDFMYGNDGIDWLRGEGGMDRLFGDEGDDILIGGIGDDIMEGGTGTDTFYGEADNDTINGGANGDVAFGQEGNDIINGGSEGDFLFGGAGRDTINGGTENDLMWGDMPGMGDGVEDIFVFEDNWGFDAIYDFELGIDQISMGAVTGLNSFSQLGIFDGGANVTVAFAGNAITLYGVTLAELNANQADFDFS